MNRSLLPVLLMCLLAARLAAADVPADVAPATIAPLPLDADLRLDDVLELYGTPSFAVASILAYHGSFAGLAADVTLFIREERLAEMMFSFPAGGLSAAELRRDADRVLKSLRVLHGPPRSVLSSEGAYKVHAWVTPSGALLHTVIYSAGRQEHVIRTRRDEVVAD